MRFLSTPALVAFALLAAPVGGCAETPVRGAASPAIAAKRLPLTIKTTSNVYRFKVEVARTEAEQARGLMFRETLAPDAGMIFPFAKPRIASFWMRNTLIPLDMIFIRADGTIARIAANTVPHSLDAVESGEPVVAVLEIPGGRSATLGLHPGAHVHWPR